MASDPKAPEVIEWRQEEGEEGNEVGDELSVAAAPSVKTTVTHLPGRIQWTRRLEPLAD